MPCKDENCHDTDCRNSYHWGVVIDCEISSLCTQPNGHSGECR